MKDFTLHIYNHLLQALKNANYTFLTFEEWCDGKAKEKFVILRHDVDLKAQHSLVTAQIEAGMGVKATYYFRVVPQSNQPEMIKAIAELGHEIGYHYEDLSLFAGDTQKAIQHFEKQLAHFRQFYPVRTVCMHGSPTSRFDNRNLWKNYNYRDFGIIGEPYFDFLFPLSSGRGVGGEVLYFTDTARMWDGDKFNVRDKVRQRTTDNRQQIINQPQIHSTFDLINWLKTNPTQSMMITTHPQRWTNNHFEWFNELILQSFKNQIKRLISKQGNK
jgi:hypothetical protein